MDEKEIVLNNKKVTETQFETEKQKLEENKGVKVVEVNKNEYKTRIQE
ncbi:MAG: hypothetical protein HGA35_03555 [Erysipelotrichaceae bacterium]|nr:hypothetical protein [Erysipelotrichaceae bacterium]